MRMENKLCPICGVIKTTSEFYSYYSKRRDRFRISNYCKSCARESGVERAKEHYRKHLEKKKQYGRDYRKANKEKIRENRNRFQRKYMEELQDCYVRERLFCDNDIPVSVSRQFTYLVEVKKLQLINRRKLKILKNGKK